MGQLEFLLLACCLMHVTVTSALFMVSILSRHRSSSRQRRQLLSWLTGVIVVMPIGFVVPQLLLLQNGDGVRALSASQCDRLHRLSTSLMYIASGLVQCFYVLRANQIASPVQQRFGRRLLVVLGLLSVGTLATFNVLLQTELQARPSTPPVCRGHVDLQFTIVIGYAVPFLVEIAQNVRFLSLVWQQVVDVRGVTQTDGLRRVVRVSLIVSLTLLAFKIVLVVPVLAVPSLDPSTIRGLVTVESTYNACSVAWPVIIIAFLKRIDARQESMAGTLGGSTPAPGTVRTAGRSTVPKTILGPS